VTIIEIIRKREFSGFVNTSLDRVVRTAPQRRWIVIGCVTDCCIEANVAELVYRGCDITVIRSLIDTWDLSAEQVRELGLPEAYIHDAERLNTLWFDYRLPAIWGVHVVNNWSELCLDTNPRIYSGGSPMAGGMA
jgi:hypothetical protein